MRSLIGAALLLAAPAALRAQTAEERLGETLDALHRLASQADFEGYFALYTDDAVFLGTDATERWTKADFMAYAQPHFDRGRGWTYTVTERHVFLAADGRTAWFDERLDNASLGETRGTGVLLLVDGDWRVAQYNLTIPIPNALAGEVVARIRETAQD